MKRTETTPQPLKRQRSRRISRDWTDLTALDEKVEGQNLDVESRPLT